jgi:GNAT superfamily N-acetyltransferase
MPEDALTLRPAVDGDGEAGAQVLVEAGVAAWSDFLGEQRIRTANAGRRHPADVVAEDAAGICGFVAWDVGTAEVTRLYVTPRRWRAGVGRSLLTTAEEALRAAGVRRAWLNTEERGPAVAFYERCGWRREGEPRERDWHGARLVEPRFVKDL